MIIVTDKIITGDDSTVLNDKAVLIDNKGIIEKIDSAEQLKTLYPDECIKEYRGGTLLPGLIDMHVHIGYYWGQSDSYTYNNFMTAYFALENAHKAFAAGVTTIRDELSPQFLCTTMNRAARKGFIQIPRIIGSDMGICMTGGHAAELEEEKGVKVANGPWEIRAAIREQVKNGAQWIKILTSHRTHTPEYTQEELNAAVDECHRVGKKISVHAGTQPSIQMCIDAGFDTIEHGTFMTVEQAQQMAQKGIAWDPTIVAYTYTYEYLEAKKDQDTGGNIAIDAVLNDYEYFKTAAQTYRNNFKQLIATGVKVVTGTDLVLDGAPVTPVARELQYMVEYGMEPIKAIQAATANGSEVLGLSHKIGQIKEGLVADLLIVEGNPLEDIANLSNIVEVYYGGKSVYKKEAN